MGLMQTSFSSNYCHGNNYSLARVDFCPILKSTVANYLTVSLKYVQILAKNNMSKKVFENVCKGTENFKIQNLLIHFNSMKYL